MRGVNRGKGGEGRGGWVVRERGGVRGGGGDRVDGDGSQGAVDFGDFVIEGKKERVAEVRGGGWCGVQWLEQLVDGGEQGAGVPVRAVDEGGEVGRFGGLESITVGGDVLLVGFGVDSEADFFEESFQLAARLLHGAEFRGVPGGRVGV